MLGQILNMIKLTQKSGQMKQQKLLKVDIMSLLKDLLQLFQIITTELMHGLIFSTKRLILLSGRLMIMTINKLILLQMISSKLKISSLT